MSLLWLALTGVIFYRDLRKSSLLSPTHTYEFTHPDGSTFKIITSNDDLVRKMREGKAPPCEDGGTTCEPWDRKWEESGITPLPGLIVNADGNIVGSVSGINVADENTKFAAWFGFAPPVLLGVLMLLMSWTVAGFRSK
jgi:hypothetical protein